MADLVIDEWLWSDLRGENKLANPDSQRETFQFLEAVFAKCDRIVIVKGSPFDQKALELWSRSDRIRCDFARYWRDLFRYNLNKSLVLDEAQLQDLPPQLAARTSLKDHYVVRALLTSNASVIVTTDNKLKDVLRAHGLSCQHRRDFVPDYILRHARK